MQLIAGPVMCQMPGQSGLRLLSLQTSRHQAIYPPSVVQPQGQIQTAVPLIVRAAALPIGQDQPQVGLAQNVPLNTND